MEPNSVSIAKPSSRVLGKMKKGQTVRITQGSGMNLIVNPGNYNTISRTFSKGRGLHIALSPDEIHHNHACGIFDTVKRTASKVASIAKPIVKTGVQIAKPFVKQAVNTAINTAGTAVVASNPELAPFVPIGVAGANHLANSAIDKVAGGSGLFGEPMGGNGLYAQPPMRARGLRTSRERASIGIHGNLMSGRGMLPPALIPQPYSANFQFQHTLPPAYQTFAKRGMH